MDPGPGSGRVQCSHTSRAGLDAGGCLIFNFDFENYRFVRLASVACYQAVDWQVGSDEIQGVVLYMQSCPVLLETA